jgi:tetratricopeptide (TPR) repeat protein
LYSFADEAGQPRVAPTFVPEQWDRAAAWMEEDAPFLEWLSTLDRCRQQWETSQDADALLPGRVLSDGDKWKERVSVSEQSFIQASKQTRMTRRRIVYGWAAAGIIVAGIASFASSTLRERRHEQALAASAGYLEDAQRLENAGDLAAALEEYSKAIEIDGNNAAARLRRGKALAKLQRPDESVAEYTAVIDSIADPSVDGAGALLADAHLARGDVALGLNRVEDALADFDHAARYLEDGYIHAKRAAILHSRLNRPEEALRAYDEALRLSPDLADVAFARGKLLEELGRSEQATKAFAVVATMASASQSTQLAARSRLQALGSAAVPAAPTVTRVFVQITDARDRDAADALRTELAAQKYDTPEAELTTISAAGDVRYFFKEDERAAQEVRAIAEYIIAARGHNVRLPTRYLVGENARRGTIELWLPSLSSQVLPADLTRQAVMKK